MNDDQNSSNPMGTTKKKHLLKNFKTYLVRSYMNSPVNFSFLTGWRYPGLPHLTGNPIVGRLISFLKPDGPLNNFLEAGKLAITHPTGICYFWLGFQSVLFITKPEHIKQLLMEQKEDISSQAPLKLFKVFFGSNIFVDQEELWEQKKAVYAKWLNKKTLINNYEQNINDAVNHCITHIKANINNEFNLQEFASRFTLHSVLNSTMQFLTVNDQTLKELGCYLDNIDENLFSAKNLFKWNLPSVIRKIFWQDSHPEKEKQKLECEFKKIVFSNNEEKIKALDNFIKDIWQLSDKELNSFTNSFEHIFGDANIAMIAGVETTSSTIQFLIKILGTCPDIEEKLCNELNTALQNSANQKLTINEIIQLPYLESVIKETLRLYSPAPAVLRTVIKPFKIDDIPVYNNDMIIFAPIVTHRLKEIWGEDAELFNPDRFLEENKSKSDAYLPFSRGPRACIGRDLAMIEIKALIAALLLNFKVKVDNENFEFSLEKGALKPKKATYVTFLPR